MDNYNPSNQSVGKALQIIEVLIDVGQPMRLADISAKVHMPSSTVFRMLSALMEYDYVNQDEDTKKYFLTLKFAKIGSIVNSRYSIRDLAHLHMRKLAIDCNEAACVAVEEKQYVIYIDVADGPDSMLKVMQYIGKRSPMHCTGVGKCFLLNYTVPQIDELIRTQGLPCFTDNTITTKELLLEDLARIRSLGYALDNEECEMGARCVAAPIKDYTGKVVAAISVSGPVSRMSRIKLQKHADAVMEAANAISKELSYQTRF